MERNRLSVVRSNSSITIGPSTAFGLPPCARASVMCGQYGRWGEGSVPVEVAKAMCSALSERSGRKRIQSIAGSSLGMVTKRPAISWIGAKAAAYLAPASSRMIGSSRSPTNSAVTCNCALGAARHGPCSMASCDPSWIVSAVPLFMEVPKKYRMDQLVRRLLVTSAADPSRHSSVSTRAVKGPLRAHLVKASNASIRPSTSISTEPSVRLFAVPVRPKRSMAFAALLRNPTPCTLPVTRMIRVEMLGPRSFAGVWLDIGWQ